MLTLIAPLLSFALPAAAQSRGWPLSRVMIAGALGLVGAGWLATALRLSQTETAYHDTYYVVASGHDLASAAALLSLIVLGQIAKERWGREDRRFTLVALWIVLVGWWLASAALWLPVNLNTFDRVSMVQNMGGALLFAGLIAIPTAMLLPPLLRLLRGAP